MECQAVKLSIPGSDDWGTSDGWERGGLLCTAANEMLNVTFATFDDASDFCDWCVYDLGFGPQNKSYSELIALKAEWVLKFKEQAA